MQRYYTSKTFYAKCSLYVFGFLIGINTNAQSFLQSIAYNTNEVNADFFLGKVNDKHIIMLNTDTGYVIKFFNKNMAETETITPKFLTESVSALGITILENTLNTVYSQYNGKKNIIYKAQYNVALRQASKPIAVDSFDKNRNTSRLQIIKSKNSKYMLAWYEQIVTGDSMNIFYRIFENNIEGEMQKISLGKIMNKFSNKLEISNTGLATIINAEKDKKGNFAALNIYLPHINAKPFTILNPETSVTNNMLSSINNANNTLHVWQWLTEIETGIFGLINTVISLQTGLPISKNVAKDVLADNAMDLNNLDEGFFIPRQIIFEADNKSVCVSEFYLHEVVQQNQTAMEFMTTANALSQRHSRSVNRYISGNVLISSFVDSAVMRHQLLRKEQISESKPSQVASYAMAVLPKGLYFVYNQMDRLENILVTNIKGNKQEASERMESSAKYAGLAMYEQYKQISSSEILVPCIEQDGISFLLINFN